MRNFSLRLRPFAQPTLRYSLILPVYSVSPNPTNRIGLCKIDHDKDGLFGSFELDVDVDVNHFIHYVINDQNTEWTGITISEDDSKGSNSIRNTIM